MRWTVVVPGALLPAPIAADVLAGATVPWLARALAQGLAEPAVTPTARGAPHLQWLWRQFGGAGEAVTAPYALHALAGAIARDVQCWHIDPVHFAFARDHLLVTPLADAPPTADEANTLARHLREALQEIAADRAPRLHLHRESWLLTLARPWSMQATPLDGALGQSAHEHWPAGTDAGAWRRLLTEVQVRWHQEKLNDAREARGERAVNALWLHGGGAWVQLQSRAFTTVAADDPVLRGWALAAGVSADGLAGAESVPAARGDALSIRRDLLLPAQFEAWGQWLLHLAELEAALASLQVACFDAGYDELVLALAGRRQVRLVRLRQADRWRFWRKSSLIELLTETEEDAT
jgi:hypothetical protein